MVKRFHGSEVERDDEATYVSFYDYDLERAKVDRLQAALKQAIEMIEETTSERQARLLELRALSTMSRQQLKECCGG